MKKNTFSAFLAMVAFGFIAHGQVGTLCTNPIVIASLPYTTTDNTANYADNYDPPTSTPIACGSGTMGNYYLGGNDVVYSFTPSGNGTVNIQIPSAPAWTGFMVFTSCANIGVAVYACSCSSAAGNRTVNNMAVVGGQTYYIVVSSWPAPQTFGYTLNITGTLANEDFAVTGFTFYPNPVMEKLQIINPDRNITEIAVHNLFGQEVIREDWTGKDYTSIDMSSLATGTYILSVSIDGRTMMKKVVKY